MTSDPNPSTPRNSALQLTPSERKGLRAVAHHLDPVVTIGDAGLSSSVLAEIERALDAHGLVKIRVHGDDRVRREALLAQVCEGARCAPVQMIGKLFVVWRPKRETGTGGNAGTSKRSPARQTKKRAGARKEAEASGPTAAQGAPSRVRPAAHNGHKGSDRASSPPRARAGSDPAPSAPRARPALGPGRDRPDPIPVTPRRPPASAPSRARPAAAGASPARKKPAFKPTGVRRTGAAAAARPLTRSARPESGIRGGRRGR